MSNIQTGAERMPHDLSRLGFLAGQSGRLITISTTPVIAGDSFEMDAVGALRLSPLRRGLAIISTVDLFTFYVPHRHVCGELWIKIRSEEHRVGKSPREIDRALHNAYEYRRILDRLYGYEVSPVLWKKVMPKLSAGRVQSVATRIVVDREKQRMAFRSADYWDIVADLSLLEQPAEGPRAFSATLIALNGDRIATG